MIQGHHLAILRILVKEFNFQFYTEVYDSSLLAMTIR